MPHSRRQFFTDIARSAAEGLSRIIQTHTDAVVPVIDSIKASQDHGPPPAVWLRPPGAQAEDAFLKACTRCTDCIEACPYDAIRRLGSEFGEAIASTPAIIVEQTPCYLCEDMPCIKACPTDALLPTERTEVRMAEVTLDTDQCYLSQGQRCDYCMERCPVKPDAIALDDQNLPRIDPEHCTGCGVCTYLCPPQAFTVEPLD